MRYSAKNTTSIPTLYGYEPYPVWREIGMGFFLMSREATNEEKIIPHESQMAHFYFLTNGLAGVMKKKFPTSGVAASGEFLFHHNC